MLLQLAVENYLSLRDRTVLSMLADHRVAHRPEQIATTNGRDVLRTVALYGANGSGKSNLVKAFRLIKEMVLEGTVREDDPLPIVPFKLDTSHVSAPSHVELEFIADDTHYSYGFEASSRRVESEWLFRIEAGDREQPLFERDSPEGANIVLGDALSTDPERRRYLGYVASGTRENQLFLAEAGQKTDRRARRHPSILQGLDDGRPGFFGSTPTDAHGQGSHVPRGDEQHPSWRRYRDRRPTRRQARGRRPHRGRRRSTAPWDLLATGEQTHGCAGPVGQTPLA